MSLLGMAACSAEKTPAPSEQAAGGPECVPLQEGYYLFQDGKFFATTPPPATPVPEASAPPAPVPGGWAGGLVNQFSGLGFPWMGLKVRDRVATVTGTAPDTVSKERALAAAESAIRSDPDGAREVSLIVDAIAVEGGDLGVGQSLATLADSDMTLADCQNAFVETMQGRNIEFQLNQAGISPASARLLDAVTGVAIFCSAYSVEIGGHTDSRGSDSYNRQLSQERAEAVKQYLVDRGVDGENIAAIGYGETRPVDTADTPEAWARNRRTEFKVSAR